MGGVATKLMQRESSNGGKVIARSGWCLFLLLCTHQPFVVELGEFLSQCQMSSPKVCQVGVDFEWVLYGQGSNW